MWSGGGQVMISALGTHSQNNHTRPHNKTNTQTQTIKSNKGVRYVIDAGFVKARGYHARLGAESLQVLPVSQAQARQRSGRAGSCSLVCVCV